MNDGFVKNPIPVLRRIPRHWDVRRVRIIPMNLRAFGFLRSRKILTFYDSVMNRHRDWIGIFF